MRARSVAATARGNKQIAHALATLLRDDIRARRGAAGQGLFGSTASVGPSPLAVVQDVRKADGMTQGPLPFLELVKIDGSGDTTLRALAGAPVQVAAGAYKFVST